MLSADRNDQSRWQLGIRFIDPGHPGGRGVRAARHTWPGCELRRPELWEPARPSGDRAELSQLPVAAPSWDSPRPASAPPTDPTTARQWSRAARVKSSRVEIERC